MFEKSGSVLAELSAAIVDEFVQEDVAFRGMHIEEDFEGSLFEKLELYCRVF